MPKTIFWKNLLLKQDVTRFRKRSKSFMKSGCLCWRTVPKNPTHGNLLIGSHGLVIWPWMNWIGNGCLKKGSYCNIHPTPNPTVNSVSVLTRRSMLHFSFVCIAQVLKKISAGLMKIQNINIKGTKRTVSVYLWRRRKYSDYLMLSHH